MKYLTLIFCLIVSSSWGQNAQLDSLFNVLHHHSADDTTKATLYHRIGFSYHTIDIDKTHAYADSLFALSTKLDYSNGMVNYFNLMGMYFDSKGKFEEALKNYKQAYSLSEKIQYQSGISSSVNNMGIIYEVLGQYPEALECYQTSLLIDEKQGDSSGLANSYLHIGSVHESQGDTARALEYYHKSRDLAKRIGNKILCIYNSLNIGYIYESQHKMEEALDVLTESYNMAKTMGEREGQLLASMMIGILYTDSHQYSKAEKYLLEAHAISKEMGSQTHESYCLFHMGRMLSLKNRQRDAYVKVKEAYRLATLFQDKSLKTSSAELLSEISAKTGNYKAAYNYHVEFKHLQDSVFSREKIAQVTQLESKLKYEKEKTLMEMEQQRKNLLAKAEKRRQQIVKYAAFIIILLLLIVIVFVFRNNLTRKKNNTQLRIQNKKIQTIADELKLSNTTKDKFFSIIAHDLKGPVGVFVELLGLLIESYNETDDDERLDMLYKIRKAGQNSYNLLLNLLDWSRNQLGKIKFSPIDFELIQSLDEVVLLLFEQVQIKQITLVRKVPEHFTLFTDQAMFETLLRNLLNNAIKYTPVGGKIEIEVEQKLNQVLVSVSDTGIGIAATDIEKLFRIDSDLQTTGTNNEKGTGLGLVLCKDFIDKMNGEIKVKSEQGKGSVFTFSIPLKA